MPAMALDGRFWQIVIEKGVMLQFGELEFVEIKVERSLENAEGFLLVEHANGEEVADLEDEASGFLKQRHLRCAGLPLKNDGLLLRRELRPQTGNGCFRTLGKLGECAPEHF